MLSISDVYGGTYRYLKRVAEATTSVEVDFLDMAHITADDFVNSLTPETKVVWIESPTNPLLVVPPLELFTQVLQSMPEDRRPILVVDNTFLSPYWSNPLDFGADIVLHSISKYINGHSDVIMGALVVRKGLEDRLVKGLRFLQNSSGACPSAFDCYLAHRGLKTLPLRALQHGINSLHIAARLANHPLVTEVRYPGLKGSKFYERALFSLSEQAKKDLRRLGWDLPAGRDNQSSSSSSSDDAKASAEGGIPYSGMITIRLKANEAQTEKFLQTLKHFALAESLGGVESLAEAPWKMTHGSIPEEERIKAGITENLVRLSVGIEDRDDLLADLERGLRVAIQNK